MRLSRIITAATLRLIQLLRRAATLAIPIKYSSQGGLLAFLERSRMIFFTFSLKSSIEAVFSISRLANLIVLTNCWAVGSAFSASFFSNSKKDLKFTGSLSRALALIRSKRVSGGAVNFKSFLELEKKEAE